MPAMTEAEAAQATATARSVIEELHGPNPFAARGRRSKDKGVAWTASQRRDKEEWLRETNRVQPVVIVNLNPFMLRVNGGMLFKGAIPACAIGEEYAFDVMRDVRWMVADKGVGFDNVEQFDPVPYVPAQLAPEYIREYTQERQVGGVIIFMGDEVPKDRNVMVKVPVQNADGEGGKYLSYETHNLAKLWNVVLGKQNAHIMKSVEKANREYEDPSKRSNINFEEVGQYARLAEARGILRTEDRPRWVLGRAEAEKGPTVGACPLCAAEPKKGASICTGCGQHVFDPVKAYEFGAIEYGHFAILNASDEQLAEIEKIRVKREKLLAKRTK